MEIDVLGPVHRHEGLGEQHLTGAAIQRVREAIPVEVNECLTSLSLHRHVDENVLVDGVKIPIVVGCDLERPHELSSVGIASEDGARPFVVAGTDVLVPRAGVGRAVIDEVERGIVRQPTPHGAAADLPRVAGPTR